MTPEQFDAILNWKPDLDPNFKRYFDAVAGYIRDENPSMLCLVRSARLPPTPKALEEWL